MDMKYQRGELSLFWAAVIVGVVTLMAVGTLLSMRHERNLFGGVWQRALRTDPGQALQDVAAQPGWSESTAIRKCLVDGKVVYSNVECDAGNSTSRHLELLGTKGIEAPKAPPVFPQSDAPESQRDKAIEKAVQR